MKTRSGDIGRRCERVTCTLDARLVEDLLRRGEVCAEDIKCLDPSSANILHKRVVSSCLTCE